MTDKPHELPELDPDVAAVAGQAPAAPDAATGEQTEQADPRQTAEVTAYIVQEMAEKVVTGLWPMVTYSNQERQTFRERLVPVLLKYNAELPPWLAAWKEELHLAACIAMTAISTVQQIQAARAAEAEAGSGEESERNAA